MVRILLCDYGDDADVTADSVDVINKQTNNKCRGTQSLGSCKTTATDQVVISSFRNRSKLKKIKNKKKITSAARSTQPEMEIRKIRRH